MHDISSVVIMAALAFVLAGFVKGFVGLGLPTVAIGLLSVVMTPSEAAALLLVPTIVTNVWQLALGPNLVALTRRLWVMLATSAVVTFVAAGFLAGSTERASTALGVALICYAIFGLAKIKLTAPIWWEPWLAPVVGVMSGVVTGTTGVLVLPAVRYFQAIGLGEEDMIQALGLSFTVSMLALAGGLAREGVFHGSTLSASLLALAPASVGMLAGQCVRLRIHPEIFRICFLVGLLGLG